MNKRAAKALRKKTGENYRKNPSIDVEKEYKRLKNKYKDIKQGKV